MEWIKIDNEAQLEAIKEESKAQPVLLFKHSTRCSISSMALNRVERSWSASDNEILKPYYLDLIQYRSISDKVASDFNVPHESPQAILIKNGEAIFDSSHMSINYNDLKEKAKN